MTTRNVRVYVHKFSKQQLALNLCKNYFLIQLGLVLSLAALSPSLLNHNISKKI